MLNAFKLGENQQISAPVEEKPGMSEYQRAQLNLEREKFSFDKMKTTAGIQLKSAAQEEEKLTQAKQMASTKLKDLAKVTNNFN
jgi:hypothetical protein